MLVLQEPEWLDLCELLRVRFERAPARTWLTTHHPRAAAFWTSKYADWLVDSVLLLAGVMLVLQADYGIAWHSLAQHSIAHAMCCRRSRCSTRTAAATSTTTGGPTRRVTRPEPRPVSA